MTNVDKLMTDQDYELLSQFLDGELSPAETRALRERLIAEPVLRAALERMRNVNERVRSALNIPGADAIPEPVSARLRVLGGDSSTSGRTAGWGLAVAASLVAAAGLMLAPQWREAADDQFDGAPLADDLLAGMLESAPSRADGWDSLEDGRQVRPVLSFSTREGFWCREYLLTDAGETFRGVACRRDATWRTEVIGAASHPGSQDDYRPAGAPGATSVESYISEHSADIPLSLEQEAELIARNWR